jgi:hypothetical protein
LESVESVESVESMESVEMQRHLVPILNPFLDQLVAMDPDLPGSHGHHRNSAAHMAKLEAKQSAACSALWGVC